MFSCLEGHCYAEKPCFLGQSFNVQNLSCTPEAEDHISFEQCVNEDVTASSYSSDPLLYVHESVPIYGAPPK